MDPSGNETPWLDDARGAARWRDTRTVLTRFDGEEYLGKVRDLSLTGLRVAVHGASVSWGTHIELAVVYEDRVVEVQGTVVHARPEADGSLVGVRCGPLAEDTHRFFAERYGAAPPLGSVK